MNSRIRENQRGFTLVELMMVVLIISLLIFILVPAINGVTKMVKVHQTRMLVNLLDLGCQQYKAAFGSYPPDAFPTTLPVADGGNNLDGWNWGCVNGAYSVLNCYAYAILFDPSDQRQSPFILTYCLQGPTVMGWRMGRDGQLNNNASASVTADFGPWVEAGNQSIQPFPSTRAGGTQYNNYFRPVFMDSFGTPISYFAANLALTNRSLTQPSDPTFAAECGNSTPDRYGAWEVRDFWTNNFGTNDVISNGAMVNNLGLSGVNGFTMYYDPFYAAMMNMTYNPAGGWTGGTSNGQCYNANSYVIWSAGPDQMFGFWLYDESYGGYILDLTFNPQNFDDITNFR